MVCGIIHYYISGNYVRYSADSDLRFWIIQGVVEHAAVGGEYEGEEDGDEGEEGSALGSAEWWAAFPAHARAELVIAGHTLGRESLGGQDAAVRPPSIRIRIRILTHTHS